MNEDMMTEAERASKLAEPAANDTPTRGKGVFYVHTLGCQMNVHDSERIAGVLEADGYVPATEEQYLNHDIDLIVMNTCAVRENAAERMYGTIGLCRCVCAAAPAGNGLLRKAVFRNSGNLRRVHESPRGRSVPDLRMQKDIP